MSARPLRDPAAQGFQLVGAGQTGNENIVTAAADAEAELQRGESAFLADKFFAPAEFAGRREVLPRSYGAKTQLLGGQFARRACRLR